MQIHILVSDDVEKALLNLVKQDDKIILPLALAHPAFKHLLLSLGIVLYHVLQHKTDDQYTYDADFIVKIINLGISVKYTMGFDDPYIGTATSILDLAIERADGRIITRILLSDSFPANFEQQKNYYDSIKHEDWQKVLTYYQAKNDISEINAYKIKIALTYRCRAGENTRGFNRLPIEILWTIFDIAEPKCLAGMYSFINTALFKNNRLYERMNFLQNFFKSEKPSPANKAIGTNKATPEQEVQCLKWIYQKLREKQRSFGTNSITTFKHLSGNEFLNACKKYVDANPQSRLAYAWAVMKKVGGDVNHPQLENSINVAYANQPGFFNRWQNYVAVTPSLFLAKPKNS